MVKTIESFIKDDPSGFYRVVIGTDSQVKNEDRKGCIDFVTAVVIHRKGKGARYFYSKERKFGTMVLRDRIYTETLYSLELAQELVPELRRRITAVSYDLEIHIDVGSLGPTRQMIKEVVGMVSGNGYTAKVKPESWGASSVADKHT
jgi:hypothetical protein